MSSICESSFTRIDAEKLLVRELQRLHTRNDKLDKMTITNAGMVINVDGDFNPNYEIRENIHVMYSLYMGLYR